MPTLRWSSAAIWRFVCPEVRDARTCRSLGVRFLLMDEPARVDVVAPAASGALGWCDRKGRDGRATSRPYEPRLNGVAQTTRSFALGSRSALVIAGGVTYGLRPRMDGTA